MMPQMDGFAVAEQIRRIPNLKDTPIVMLSSAWDAESATRCQALGIDHCLIKPAKQSDLLDAIISVFRVATADEPSPQTSVPDRPTKTTVLRILLAEDGLVNQKVAVDLLEQRGHRVTVANNGQEAVAAFESATFDVVLMDVQMPAMDGFEATALIRAHEKASGGHTPIIAMTAHAM